MSPGPKRSSVAPGLVMVVDTREQTPLDFAPFGVPSVRGTLKTGDYSIVGEELPTPGGGFCVERKSLVDAFASFARGRERFVRELERLREYHFRAIVLEGGLDDVIDHRPPRTVVEPATVINSLLSWLVEYGVVPLFGSRDRRRTALLVLRLAERFWRMRHPNEIEAGHA